MATYENFVKELVTQGIERTIVDKIIEEYKIVKKANLLGDDEKVILHSAKVSDLILALIKNKVTKTDVDIDTIHFNKLFEEILKYPKPSAQDVILTLAIPRVAESIYTLRNKKNVAHVKTIDPNFIDASYCVSACDWMLSELAMLFYISDSKGANELINSMLAKRIPLVEEFEDGSVVILKRDLSLKEEFLLYLYYRYPNRIMEQKLTKAIRYENPTYAEKVLTGLENERLIHRTKDGNKLTRLGITFVDDEILIKKKKICGY